MAQSSQAAALKCPATASHSDQSRRAARWRKIGYVVAFAILIRAHDGGGEQTESSRYCRRRWSVCNRRTGQGGIYGFVPH